MKALKWKRLLSSKAHSFPPFRRGGQVGFHWCEIVRPRRDLRVSVAQTPP
jgi:hypothetical protein